MTVPAKSVEGTTTETLLAATQRTVAAIEALGAAAHAVQVPASPQLARSAQHTENRWRQLDDEFGLLTAAQAGRRMGSINDRAARTRVSSARGCLLAVRRGGRNLYPGFQFDDDGHPRPAVARLLGTARSLDVSDETFALWLVAPAEALDAQRPVDLLADDGALDRVDQALERRFGVRW
ncbi:hypothetical protein GCM10011512_09610 [Tersicoccus solisilvae]|uniref:Antitoxin Xre/MbcA/ParS-like toxin-binding domain-containing protein n=1 Tax=Tersicoccus solisilvae TaxID=1882339 RepID=A0ABQ1NU13_9MICC|nr:antitoxin Xre/MbcA/ParS toxin-binding domain-containing protein [Tersicoccus solisilvae]GGC84844.1 hypothetical protein GCM10011512_09610 [Tersicoccus solisilvae]